MDEANRIRAAIDELESKRIPADHPFLGVWHITYTDGPSRTYQIHLDDTVTYFEGERLVSTSARLFRRGDDVLVSAGSGTIERLTRVGDRILVEHWNPQSAYLHQPPNPIGIGVSESGDSRK